MEEEKESEVVSGNLYGLTHRESQKHKLQIKFSYLLRPQGQPFIPYQAVFGGYPGGVSGKKFACQCRRHKRRGSIPGSGRYPGGGNGIPLQYSCLGNPMDSGAWWATVHGVTKRQTQLSAHTRS